MAITKLNSLAIPADTVVAADIADESIDEARIQISNAGTNGQFLSKQSGNTGGLTWADPTGWKDCTEGLITTTSAQNDIDFTIPADANRIKVMFWSMSAAAGEECYIRIGQTNGTVLTSGYENTNWYMSNNSMGNLQTATDAIRLEGWGNTANYWYGSLDMQCIALDGRRWYWNWFPYNSYSNAYAIQGNGKIGLSSGQQIRKIRFTTASGSNGYDSGCFMRVYHAEL